MSTGYVREWGSAAVVGETVVQVPRGCPLRSQKVTFTTSTAITNAIGADCALAEVWADADACIALGDDPTAANDASAGSGPLTAKTHFFFQPPPGGLTKVAFVDFA